MVSSKMKISVVQLDVGGDREKNLNNAERLVVRAAKNGADIICLPELFSYMGSFEHPNKVAETESGPSLSLVRTLAKKYCVHIVAGSILIRFKGGLPENKCFFVGPDGAVISKYSKMHLFDIHIKGKIRYEESKSMKVGNRVVVAKSPFGKIGFAICNDLRYPEVFRKMVLSGARIIFVPSAFTKFTGKNHWLALTRVRAMEDQCFMVAINQSGKNNDGVKFFGSSLIIDPWGKVLAEGPSRGNAVISKTVDLTMVDKIRKDLPALKKIHKTYPISID